MTVAWSYIVWDGTRGKERDYLVCCVLHEEKLGSRGWFQAFDLDIAMLSLSKDMYTLKYETSIQVNNRLNS